MKPTPPGWPRISSSLYYENPSEAIDWLVRAGVFTGAPTARAWSQTL